MTKFNKTKFTTGECLIYEGEFIARFKRNKKNRSGFISFLVKNFTVEEYLDKRNKGISPMMILEAKGYVSLTVKNVLKAAGYEATVVGYNQYIQDQVKSIRNITRNTNTD